MTTILVQAEDGLSEGAAKHLVDRLVPDRANAPWLREQWTEQLASARTYEPIKPNYQARIPSSLPGKAKDAYRALRAAQVRRETLGEDVILLLAFDSDLHPEEQRIRAGVAAVKSGWPGIPTVIAEATPEFDAWVLMGHEAKQTHEKQALSEVTRELSFDPRERPHELNSTTGNARDAKKLCKRLLCLEEQADPQKHHQVLDALDAPIPVLLTRGSHTGFPEFVRDVEMELLPALGDHRVR